MRFQLICKAVLNAALLHLCPRMGGINAVTNIVTPQHSLCVCSESGTRNPLNSIAFDLYLTL